MTGAWSQIWRYGVVGIVSNAVLYGAYLLLTAAGMGPKTAMTLLYALGTLQTFVFNKRWSFSYEGRWTPSLVRYAITYAFGYVFNLALILIFVDVLHQPHRWVQAAAIVAVAGIVFLLQRYWVFRQDGSSGRVTDRAPG